MENRAELLVEILLDQDEELGARHDAVMYLKDYDDEIVLKALVFAGSNPLEDDIVLDSCGESLASIWIRKNVFDKEGFSKLVKQARSTAYSIIKSRKPEWLS